MANANSEKEKALDLAVGTIEKQFGKGSIMRLGAGETISGGEIETISTGSLGSS
jgi:recombination protein RecA